MVNKRKVRLMARTAMYEKHDGKKELAKSKYYKGDYIGAHMLLSGVFVTIGYLLCVMLVCIYKFEYIISNLTEFNYRKMFSTGIISYVVLLIIYIFISYLVYSARYDEAKNGEKFYISHLKKIDKLDKMKKNELEKE